MRNIFNYLLLLLIFSIFSIIWQTGRVDYVRAIEINNPSAVSGSVTYPITVANGGTAGTTSANARTNLGLGTANSPAFSGLTVTGTATLPSQQTAVGSASVTVGSGFNYTMNVSGGGIIVGTGTGNADFSGLTEGVALGTVTNAINLPRTIDYTRVVVNVAATTTPKIVYTGTIAANSIRKNGRIDFDGIYVVPGGAGSSMSFLLDGTPVTLGTMTGNTNNKTLFFNVALIAAGTTSAAFFVPPVAWSTGQAAAMGSATLSINFTATHTFSYLAVASGGTQTLSWLGGSAVATDLQ